MSQGTTPTVEIMNGTKRQDDHLVVLFAVNQDVTPDIILIVADHLDRICPHALSVASLVVTREIILLLRTPRFKMQVAQPLKLPIRQTGSEHQFSPPSIRLRKSLPLAGVATQTDLVIANREHPIVNFLENSEAACVWNLWVFQTVIILLLVDSMHKSPKVPITRTTPCAEVW